MAGIILTVVDTEPALIQLIVYLDLKCVIQLVGRLGINNTQMQLQRKQLVIQLSYLVITVIKY